MPIEAAKSDSPNSEPRKPTTLRGLRSMAMSKVEPTDKLLHDLGGEEIDRALEQAQPASVRLDNRVIDFGLERLPAVDKEKDERRMKAMQQDIRHKEFLAKEAAARQEDEAYISQLRQKMGLHDPMKNTQERLAVSGDELQKLQEHAQFIEGMTAASRGQLERGGQVEKPIEAVSARASSTSFQGFESTAESEPGMFRLEDLEKKEPPKKSSNAA